MEKSKMEKSKMDKAREALTVGEEESRVLTKLEVRPHRPGDDASFYEGFALRGLRVESISPGYLSCSFKVPPRLTDSNGNMSVGAIANLVDEVGGAAMHADGHHMKVSVDMSISFLANAKLHDELEISSRVLGHRGSYYSGTYVLLRNKTSGEVIAEGRHSLFGNLRRSKISTTSSNSHSVFKHSGSKTVSTDSTHPEEAQLSIAEISRATNNFSQENVIGQGGFGTVYKGKLIDGSVIAVKRAGKNLQNKAISAEFRSEIGTLSSIEHQNLVRLLGYLEDNEEKIVVIEYVGNGTLREHLDGTRGNDLELAQRLDIAIDVAHAITYLHTYTDHPIIHRDIKASNILLTENLRAKVADFGFARLAAEDPDATHISTQIKGTAGYLDPEYIRTYQLTEKSDLYSFGVLLVELVTGRRPIEHGRDLNKERLTTRWAMQKFQQREVVIAMDPRLRRSPASIRAVDEVMALAYACMASPRNSRPSMKRCAEVLWEIRRDFHTVQPTTAASQRPAG